MNRKVTCSKPIFCADCQQTFASICLTKLLLQLAKWPLLPIQFLTWKNLIQFQPPPPPSPLPGPGHHHPDPAAVPTHLDATTKRSIWRATPGATTTSPTVPRQQNAGNHANTNQKTNLPPVSTLRPAEIRNPHHHSSRNNKPWQ